MKITDELIQERIDLIMKEKEDEILADIDKRVEAAIKKTIREMFSEPTHSWSSYIYNQSEKEREKEATVSEYISDKIGDKVISVVDGYDVDKEMIVDLVTKKVKSMAKNIEIALPR